MPSSPVPFQVQWDEAKVADVLARVRNYPFPPAPLGGGWTYGCDEDFLKKICAYWLDGYDWRAAQDELNRFPQFTAEVDGHTIHFLHVIGEAGGKRPLLLSHGWPGSIYEFWGAIEKLAFPTRFGGKAEDAFDLVIPSLPGYGFSSKPQRPVGQRTAARLFNQLMTQVLGYDRYMAQGGDWGAVVTGWLGFDHATHVKAVHLNMLGVRSSAPMTGDAEKAWAGQAAMSMQMYGAYLTLQVSKPQSIAWAVAGNPVGQAAWILERFHDWSDLRTKAFEEVYSLDQLLNNLMIYIMNDAFTTSVWFYRGMLEEGGVSMPDGQKVEVPTGFACFPGEAAHVSPPPRSLFERSYNLVRWTDMPAGGHFACMEEPDLFVAEVRAFAHQVGV